ncbi:MAG: dipeptidyl aminopeptidase/acylaminoacyl peptidase, partial [Candidatus Paceibacteria bacterium]
ESYPGRMAPVALALSISLFFQASAAVGALDSSRSLQAIVGATILDPESENGDVAKERVSGFLASVASWGYAVVAPQYRGNAGAEENEEFGGAGVNDVLNAILMLESMGRVDSTRIALYGGSRGGINGLQALRDSPHFAAAAFRCGVTNLVSWREERPEMEPVFEELIPGYSPTDDTPLEKRSAIYWAHELPRETPILWMHGTADWRVSPGSALRFAQALQEHKIPYRLVMFEGADQSLTGFAEERNQLTREWFDRYVRDGADAPSMEPHGD